jgi:hypothetical protein
MSSWCFVQVSRETTSPCSSSVGYGLDGQKTGFDSWWGQRFASSSVQPDRLWDSSSPYSSGNAWTQAFAARRECVELYPLSPRGLLSHDVMLNWAQPRFYSFHFIYCFWSALPPTWQVEAVFQRTAQRHTGGCYENKALVRGFRTNFACLGYKDGFHKHTFLEWRGSFVVACSRAASRFACMIHVFMADCVGPPVRLRFACPNVKKCVRRI